MNSQNTITNSGFNRIRSLSAAGAVSLGMLAGGSARAATVTLSRDVTAGDVEWTGIDNGVAPVSGLNAFGLEDMFIASSASFPTVSGSSSLTDAFDGALGLVVNGIPFNNPDGDVDLTGTTVTTDIASISGLDVQVEYHFFTTRRVVRAMFTFTNPTAADISLTALTGGQTGRSSNFPQATSDGDTTIEDSDQWYIVSSEPTGTELPGGGQPILTFSRYSLGAPVIPTNSNIPNGSDDYSFQYTTTVPAGETIRIVTFVELSLNVTSAKAGAPDFEGLNALDAAGLLVGLDAAARNQIVNYGAGVAIAPRNVPVATPFGLVILTGLLGLLGRRFSRKQKRVIH